MAALNPSWTGLTGSGVQVTVADSGLDSGVNDGTMHPDFQGRINGIESLPIPQWWKDVGWIEPAASLDDGAAMFLIVFSVVMATELMLQVLF